MLVSLAKQLFGLGRSAEEPAPAGAPQPYFDVGRLTDSMARRAEKFRAGGYLDYPRFVHLETLALCNAACSFCPYPSVERKGTKMPDSLIEKIIDDLTAIPASLTFQLAPYKLSEPFLEPRLFDIMDLAAARLPGVRFTLITNGSALIERQIDQLTKQTRVTDLAISVNYDNAEEYEKVMKIPFARTVSRLDMLHDRKVQGSLAVPVRLTRVSCDRESDRRFLRWAYMNYPAFEAMIVPRNDWLGDLVTDGASDLVPDVACHRWFDLSIVATGEVALCCMDSEAKFPKGNVNTEHALAIYNRPALRELRMNLISRRAAGSPCDRCTYLAR